MSRKLSLIGAIAALFAVPGIAHAAEAVTNGEFESGATGWTFQGGEEGRDKLNGGGGAGDRCVGGPSRDKATPSCEKSKTL